MKSDRYVNGYKLVYRPGHPLAMKSRNWDGYVYEHRWLAYEASGGAMRPEDEVHHKNRMRSSNALDNLEFMTPAEHRAQHSHKLPRPACGRCGKPVKLRVGKYCSYACSRQASRKVQDRPSKEELCALLENSSFLAVGRKYGVSDNAIRKWLKD